MIIGLEDLINEVNEAKKINLLVRKDPSTVAASLILQRLNSKEVRAFYFYSNDDLHQKLDRFERHYFSADLILNLGMYGLNLRFSKNYNMINLLDTISISDFFEETRTYEVNYKTYLQGETTSYAHTAMRIVDEFGVEIPNALKLFALIGDRDDNKEIGTTEFQQKLIEELNLSHSLFFIKGLSEFGIFNLQSIAYFVDLNKIFNFKYKVDGDEPKELVDVKSFLEKFNLSKSNLENKLISIASGAKLSKKINSRVGKRIVENDFRAIFGGTYKGYNIDELLAGVNNFIRRTGYLNYKSLSKPYFYNNIVKNYINDSIERKRHTIQSNLEYYSRGAFNIKRIGSYNMVTFIDNDDTSFGGKSDLLFFFPNETIVIEPRSGEELTSYYFYSKSSLHAGMIASLFALSKNFQGNSEPKYGNGERFRGLAYRRGDVVVDYLTIKDVIGIRWSLTAIDNYSRYRSVADGIKIKLYLDDWVELYYPNGHHSKKPTKEEVDAFEADFEINFNEKTIKKVRH